MVLKAHPYKRMFQLYSARVPRLSIIWEIWEMRQLAQSSSCAKHMRNASRHGGHVPGSLCPTHCALAQGSQPLSTRGNCCAPRISNPWEAQRVCCTMVLCPNHQHLALGCLHSGRDLFVSVCCPGCATRTGLNQQCYPPPAALKPNLTNKIKKPPKQLYLFPALQNG